MRAPGDVATDLFEVELHGLGIGEGQREACNQRQAFARVVVDNSQDPEPASIGEGVAEKVQAPALVPAQAWVDVFPGPACGRRVCGPAASLPGSGA